MESNQKMPGGGGGGGGLNLRVRGSNDAEQIQQDPLARIFAGPSYYHVC